MKKIAIGMLAHVDAGKTTLSEALLYESGMIKEAGRVDNQNAFLDTDMMERARGITIFSKQAVMQCRDTVITLIDTPGHVDFSAEMERALWVMDYAVLVISGADGVQGHTLTLWRLLEQYHIPVFIFINKMDQVGTDSAWLMENIRTHLGEECVDFTDYAAQERSEWLEQVAVCDEELLEQYLDRNAIEDDMVCDYIAKRKVVPCYFGSALKMEGITEFLEGILHFVSQKKQGQELGAKVFKIARDAQGNRLTFLKITSGTLHVKDVIGEKVNQIRVYSGEKYEMVQEADAGMVCAVTGPVNTKAGQGIGTEKHEEIPLLEPVLTYTVEFPENVDAALMLGKLRQLEEEEPQLHILWQEQTKTIQVKLMGEVQIEVLKQMIEQRFGVEVSFGTGKIIYKETIADTVEGVGHFEPLRHYAEVHLLMEPGEPGGGMQFLTDCSEDLLDKNWQRLILTHLEEKEHVGVLTGSPITDIRITLTTGRAHAKHTEGGDFRQATYRAVRQGLMQAQSVLLEPYYTFRLELPSDMVGRAMTDIENMYGHFEPPELNGTSAVLTGYAPVSTMRDYQIAVNSYTKGMGNLICTLKGYDVCHNSDEVIEQFHYNPEKDLDNPSCSVFCSHGAGFIVSWDRVPEYMHLESAVAKDSPEPAVVIHREAVYDSIDEEQINEIMNRTFYANEKRSKKYKKHKAAINTSYKGREKHTIKDKYLIVDGYNIIHAWDDLKCYVEDNLDGARLKLMDILCNYQAFVKCELIVVFDAYKVKGNLGEMFDYHNIHVVYTKEAETADSYIEKLTHKVYEDYSVTVATSDGLVQLITRGQNCLILSAREFREEIERVNRAIREYVEK